MHDVEAWSGCIAGALEEQDYLEKLRRAGFADAAIDVTNVYDSVPEDYSVDIAEIPDGVQVVSGFVHAVKPSA